MNTYRVITRIVLLLSCSVATLSVRTVVAADGKSKEQVAVGMSAALSGPTAELGLMVRSGVEAVFEEYNRRSQGTRHLQLIVLDDGYEPSRTGPNMRELIHEHKVVAVLGNVGAPCAVAAVPIANETRTPLIGYVTGGSVLRKAPPDRYVINYRAGLTEEAAAIIDGFVASGRINPEEIAFFTQRDTFGDTFFDGGLEALKRHGLTDATQIVHARYERNSVAIQRGLSELLLSARPIQAIAIAGAGPPTAEFIREARSAGFNGLIASVSFVNASKLVQRLGEAGDGVIVVEVVPHLDSDLPLVRRFHEAMRHRDEQSRRSFIAFEGFVAATIFCLALDNVKGTVDRERLTDSLLALGDFDPGLGVTLNLTPDQHQACHTLWPTVLRAGQVQQFDWNELVLRERRP